MFEAISSKSYVQISEHSKLLIWSVHDMILQYLNTKADERSPPEWPDEPLPAAGNLPPLSSQMETLKDNPFGFLIRIHLVSRVSMKCVQVETSPYLSSLQPLIWQEWMPVAQNFLQVRLEILIGLSSWRCSRSSRTWILSQYPHTFIPCGLAKTKSRLMLQPLKFLITFVTLQYNFQCRRSLRYLATIPPFSRGYRCICRWQHFCRLKSE